MLFYPGRCPLLHTLEGRDLKMSEEDVTVSFPISADLFQLIQYCAQMVGLSVEEFMGSAVADKMRELLEAGEDRA